MSRVICPRTIIDDTLGSLRSAGETGKEQAIFWLSQRGRCEDFEIVDMLVPRQETAEDFFYIPPHAMKEMMANLRSRRLSLRTQIHSHPQAAFHSRADNKWAIVRHEGALSLVVPYFAANVTLPNFMESIAAYRLRSNDRWVNVPGVELAKYLVIR